MTSWWEESLKLSHRSTTYIDISLSLTDVIQIFLGKAEMGMQEKRCMKLQLKIWLWGMWPFMALLTFCDITGRCIPLDMA